MTQFSQHDKKYMGQALELAKQAAEQGEVPVGAVLVQFDEEDNAKVIGRGFNQPIAKHDPTSHAEIVALRDACTSLNNYRLPENTTLYVSLEPCTMCVGALIHARLNRLVFATKEPRAGMVGSQANLLEQDFYNHNIKVQFGLYADESAQILRDFFRERRNIKKTQAKDNT